MKTRTHLAHRIDRLDDAGELIEQLAGVEDFELAVATYRAAVARWPGATSAHFRPRRQLAGVVSRADARQAKQRCV